MWFEIKEYDKALEECTRAVDLAPQDPAGYLARFAVWLAKEQYEQAFEDCNEAIRLDPKNALGYRSRASVLVAQFKFDEALPDCNKSIELEPDDPIAHFNRGIVWSTLGFFDKAAADYDAAIRLNPKYVRAYENRGINKFWQGDYQGSLSDLNQAIQLDSQRASVYAFRAWLWSTCPDAKYRDARRAIESATRGCELTRWSHPRNLAALASAYAEAGDFESAIKYELRAQSMILDEPTMELSRERLERYRKKQPFHEDPGALRGPGITRRPRGEQKRLILAAHGR